MGNSNKNSRRANGANNKGNNAQAQTPQTKMHYGITIQYTKITPLKDGNRKKVETVFTDLTEAFSTKEAKKLINSMLYRLATSGVGKSVCKTTYSVYVTAIKSDIKKEGESISSGRLKIFETEPLSLNSSPASIGAWLNKVKPYMHVALDNMEFGADISEYTYAAKLRTAKSRVRSYERLFNAAVAEENLAKINNYKAKLAEAKAALVNLEEIEETVETVAAEAVTA